jgi:hypothetical protein
VSASHNINALCSSIVKIEKRYIFRLLRIYVDDILLVVRGIFFGNKINIFKKSIELMRQKMKLKTILQIIGVTALAITMAGSAAFANGTGASNSANYVSDLQKKQESVASIKEDTVMIEKELARKLNESGALQPKTSREKKT